jgi:CHAD domain-containing protein
MALNRRRIEKAANKLRKLLKKVPSSPAPEHVHSFRTSARRLETVLKTLPLDNRPRGKRLSKQIAKLRRAAGKLRDLDVLTVYAAGLSHDSSESECTTRLLEYLGAEREKRARKFHNLQRRHTSNLRRDLKRVSQSIESILPPKGDGRRNGELVTSNVAATALTLLSDLTQPPQLQRGNLHEYRLKVKELRNVLQMANNTDHQSFMNSLGDVKDAIGEWHDWEALGSTADETLDHGRNCRLLGELRKTAATKYQRALHLAQAMRREYLNMSKPGTKASHNGSLQPSQQVWSAMASLISLK